MSALDAHGLRSAADHGMELQARFDDVCAQVRTLILGPVADILDQLGDAQRDARYLTGLLDEMARAAHHSAERAPDEPNPLTVRAIVNALSHPLAVLADPTGHDAAAFVNASSAVKSVIAQVPAHKLLSNSVRKNIGGARHRLLAALINGDQLELSA